MIPLAKDRREREREREKKREKERERGKGRRKRLDYSEKKMQIAQGRICNWKLYLGDNDITVKAPVALRISLNTNDAVFFSMVNPVT